MDPVTNPFAPGAGNPPPELAGRDALLDAVQVAVKRAKLGRPAKSVLLVGLRGVGKTVLLDRMRDNAEADGVHTLRMEAPENRSLPAILAPQLRQALLRLSRNKKAKDLAQRALRGLVGFARALKVKYHDIEIAFDTEEEPGLADNGDLEHDLAALLEAAGMAAKKGDTALALFVDELQYVAEDELAALITALHRTAQRQLPVVMAGGRTAAIARSHGQREILRRTPVRFPGDRSIGQESCRGCHTQAH
jgi:GTPase SAR1 family protein